METRTSYPEVPAVETCLLSWCFPFSSLKFLSFFLVLFSADVVFAFSNACGILFLRQCDVMVQLQKGWGMTSFIRFLKTNVILVCLSCILLDLKEISAEA